MAEKLLIVDDDANVRFVLQEAFTADYAVFAATDGNSAIEIVKKERPAIVLLDINMPEPDGLAVLQLIKETGQKPVIWMLTGVEDLETVVKTLKLGASGYITKPFDIVKVREIVAGAAQGLAHKEGDKPSDRPWRIKKQKK